MRFLSFGHVGGILCGGKSAWQMCVISSFRGGGGRGPSDDARRGALLHILLETHNLSWGCGDEYSVSMAYTPAYSSCARLAIGQKVDDGPTSGEAWSLILSFAISFASPSSKRHELALAFRHAIRVVPGRSFGYVVAVSLRHDGLALFP